MVTFTATLLTGSAWVAIGLATFGLFMANLGGPGWVSWMTELIPAPSRGHYWSYRNSIIGVVQLAAILAAGWLLDFAKANQGEALAYGVLFGLATVFRLGSVLALKAQHEPPMPRSEASRQHRLWDFLRELPSTNFGRFTLFYMALNFALVMIYPLMQVHLLKNLQVSYEQYSWVTMAFTVASFLLLPYWGPLADRFGNRRILLVSAAALPLVALGWAFATDWRLLMALQVLGGFLAGGVTLAANNYVFDSVEPERLPKTWAYYTVVTMVASFAGSLAGGVLAQALGDANWAWAGLGPITGVFLVAAVLRVLVLLFLARSFVEVRPVQDNPGLRYFYVDKPIQDVAALFRRRS
jgi:MFS family permease